MKIKKKYFIFLFFVILVALAIIFRKDIKNFGLSLIKYAEHADFITAGLILGLIGIADSSFFSLPESNDFLIIYFTIINPKYMLWYVFVSAIGSVIGSVALFSVGRKGETEFLKKRFKRERIERVEEWFKKYDIWAILIPCMIPPPMPFKLFILTAGLLNFKYPRVITATFFGRMIRYLIWGILALIFRDEIKLFFKHHLIETGLIIMVIFIISGLTWYILEKKKSKE